MVFRHEVYLCGLLHDQHALAVVPKHVLGVRRKNASLVAHQGHERKECLPRRAQLIAKGNRRPEISSKDGERPPKHDKDLHGFQLQEAARVCGFIAVAASVTGCPPCLSLGVLDGLVGGGAAV